MVKFRFQDLKIWHLAIENADELFDIADGLEQKRLFRFAEQLRGSGMSMSNNIAEGSGSDSNNPKGRVPRALPVGEWEVAHRASSIACVLERVPRALPVGIYKGIQAILEHGSEIYF